MVKPAVFTSLALASSVLVLAAAPPSPSAPAAPASGTMAAITGPATTAVQELMSPKFNPFGIDIFCLLKCGGGCTFGYGACQDKCEQDPGLSCNILCIAEVAGCAYGCVTQTCNKANAPEPPPPNPPKAQPAQPAPPAAPAAPAMSQGVTKEDMTKAAWQIVSEISGLTRLLPMPMSLEQAADPMKSVASMLAKN
ncbi:hypothetical protein GQ42DRAFT_177704 [Ramicandelaber brevisporus]|nr:hypothetical protein GQ42DRAFT_177704 [Ramicandelaber brevisporus]